MDGSLLSGSNLGYLEGLYEAWRSDRRSVDPKWDEFFREEEGAARLREGALGAGGPRLVSSDLVYKQSRVDSLIWGFRDVGYLYARLNPLTPSDGEQRNYYAQPTHTYEKLTPQEYGLGDSDLDTEFSAGRALKPPRMRLAEILQALRETYCSTVAVEFLHIQNKPIRRWLISRMESARNKPSFTRQKKRAILEELIRAEEFEHFMHSAFIGQKRFSLEGAEVVIPALNHLVDSAPELGIREIVMGMTHRGRLTVLNRVMNEPAGEIFRQFEGHESPGDYGGGGDVRYHLGYSTDRALADGSTVRVHLAANPSHLESVDPVVEGMARAAQIERGGGEKGRREVLPVILHGDAAFSGQGVVSETFNLSTLSGYKTGGTVHLIINNQIGFTTSVRDARSSFFPTDAAKALPVPIFHVNSDDPEGVVYTMDLALRYRQTFERDVVVDVFCYRKYGHNEGDEPSFTHPLMYKIIQKKKSQAASYAERCRQEGVFSAEEEEGLRRECRAGLKGALDASPRPGARGIEGDDGGDVPGAPSSAGRPAPAPSEERIRFIASKILAQPGDFHVHPKLKRIVEEKAARFRESGTVDWAFAESLAFGSLLLEGVAVRLSGQDSARGTFSQRHLIWWDAETLLPSPYVPLAELSAEQAPFAVYDSPLSEYSILGFEYGYSLGRPRDLVIWEAQFGDFSNGAQVITDNYIVAGEAKWGSRSRLVMLLPHGYEGQGPEHSSGHLERFLMLAARDNIRVANCTTPAQYFHLLRRQVLSGPPKPLVVMTPKSLLRHPRAVSGVSELAGGGFSEVLDDPGRPEKPERLLLCSGKFYYDLLARREESGNRTAAIARIEQLYPFPKAALSRLLEGYRDVKRIVWAQEEPANRGAWRYLEGRLRSELGLSVAYAGREESASPATGYHNRHAREQESILAEAFAETGERRAGGGGNGVGKTGSGSAAAAGRKRGRK